MSDIQIVSGRPPLKQYETDVTSSVLPTGAATEAKQDDIITAIDNINELQRATDMEGKGQVAVGTTAVELTFTGTPESIIIQADEDNSGYIYVGKSDVASDGSNAIIKLNGGSSITMDYDDTTNAVYVVGSAASQNVWAGALYD